MSDIVVEGNFASVHDALVEGLRRCTFRVQDGSFTYEYWGCKGTHEAIYIEPREQSIDLRVVVPAADDAEEPAEEDCEGTYTHEVKGCRVTLLARWKEGHEPTVEDRNGYWVITGSWDIKEVD